MQGSHYGKRLIYYRPIFRLTKLAFLRARARQCQPCIQFVSFSTLSDVYLQHLFKQRSGKRIQSVKFTRCVDLCIQTVFSIEYSYLFYSKDSLELTKSRYTKCIIYFELLLEGTVRSFVKIYVLFIRVIINGQKNTEINCRKTVQQSLFTVLRFIIQQPRTENCRFSHDLSLCELRDQ